VKYFFHPGAEAEHLAEVAFYESRHKGLGAESRRSATGLQILVVPG
jgi:hypothetical protein